MNSETVKLRNNHRTAEQSVWVGDRRWVLPPQVVESFPKKIAVAFLTERGRYVAKYDAPEGYIVDGIETVWLANNTGNPFEPEMIERQFYKGGKEEIEKVPNPLCKPKSLKWHLHTGQTFTQGETAIGFQDISVNYPPTQFELAPYERKPFAKHFADRALVRDAFHETGFQRAIISARAPSSFEPNDSWSLDEIRLYCVLVDAQGIMDVIGKMPDEAAFRKEKAAEEKIDAAKRKLLHTLFFRVIDDAWVMPSREYFTQEARAAKLPGWEKDTGSVTASAE